VRNSLFIPFCIALLATTLISCGGSESGADKGKEEQPEIKTGEETQFYPNGSIFSMGYRDTQGREHGLWSTWYENGNLWTETQWEFGKMHGPYAVWHPNGKPQIKGRYFNGKKVGTWKVYSEDGKMSNEKTWD
jgi:antitoxin component YwqK of YwqJK toxin-antitoxin module